MQQAVDPASPNYPHLPDGLGDSTLLPDAVGNELCLRSGDLEHGPMELNLQPPPKKYEKPEGWTTRLRPPKALDRWRGSLWREVARRKDRCSGSGEINSNYGQLAKR